MAGNLLHGREFRKGIPYLARDGKEHYEVSEIDMDFFSIGRQTWDAIVLLAEELGIDPNDWPVYDDEIDLPLDEIGQKNHLLAKKTVSLVENDLARSDVLRKIVGLIRNGQKICYCKT